MVAVMSDATREVVIANVPDVAPAGTVTVDGIPAALPLTVNGIARPPDGAALLIVNVPVAVFPPTTFVGDIVIPVMTGPVTLRAAVWVDDPSVAVIVAVKFEATTRVDTVNVPVV